MVGIPHYKHVYDTEEIRGGLYIKIDDKLLSTLPPDALKRVESLSLKVEHAAKEIAQKEGLELKERAIYLRFCPYCKVFSFTSFELDGVVPTHCENCSESEPLFKITQAIYESIQLFALSKDSDNYTPQIDKSLKFLLLEQCVIKLITGLEIYLKDVYSTLLNLKYVKRDNSLIDLFQKEGSNEFMNIGKASRKFKQDLGIDLSYFLDKEEFHQIDILQSKRNVIVHNLGLVDKKFLDQCNLELNTMVQSDFYGSYELDYGVFIPLTYAEVVLYIEIIRKFIVKFHKMYDEEYKKAVIEDLSRENIE